MHYLNLTEGMVVLFADIIGFKNIVRNSKDVTMNDVGGIIINFDLLNKLFSQDYSKKVQKQLNVKLLWISDSIVISTKKRYINNLLKVLVDVIDKLYIMNLSIRGAICIGKLYHEQNIWGPAYIDVVEMERDVAVYPRIVINNLDYEQLIIEDAFTPFFEKCETENVMQLNFFAYKLKSILTSNKNIGIPICIYIKFILENYRSAKKNEHITKYVWLAEKLSQSILKYNKEIDENLCKNGNAYISYKGKVQNIVNHKICIQLLGEIKLTKGSDEYVI